MTAFLPGRPTIDAYGGGGFRFGGLSHRGSILALPSGIYGWPVQPGGPTIGDLTPVLAEIDRIDLFILGTGRHMVRPAEPVRDVLADAGLAVECMATGHAVATYNLLLGEGRRVAAGLIAVGEAG